MSSGGIADLNPHEDHGSETLFRYEYQELLAIPLCVEMAFGSSDIVAVYPEFIEDLAIEHEDKWRFIQVKSHATSKPPWSLSEAISSGTLASLWRAATQVQAAAAADRVDFELGAWFSGPVRVGSKGKRDLLNVLVAHGHNGHLVDDASWMRRIQERFDDCTLAQAEAKVEELIDAIAGSVDTTHDGERRKLRADEARELVRRMWVQARPPLDGIEAAVRQGLREVASDNLAVGALGDIFNQLLFRIKRAASGVGERTQHAELFVNVVHGQTMDDGRRRQAEAKRLGRGDIAELLERLRDDVAHPQLMPFQVPALDREFIERPDELGQLVTRLVAVDDGQSGPKVVGLYGMGGTGKSVLAAAAAHERSVFPDRFADGVLWATLGQEPAIEVHLARWIRTLGDPAYVVSDKAAARDHLNDLIGDRSLLLVIDDAWDVTATKALVAGNERCAVLVTTREPTIARGAGAGSSDLYELDVMTAAQAVALLTPADSPLQDDELELIDAVASELGRLPLALSLATATAVEIGWEPLLDELRREVVRLERLEPADAADIADPAIRKQLSLVASVNLSIGRLSSARLTNFAWLGILAEDAAFDSQTVAALWQCEADDAFDDLRFLHAKSLIKKDGESVSRQYRVHDVLHHAALRLLTRPAEPAGGELPGLELTLDEARNMAVDRFLDRPDGAPMHSVATSPYLLDHLVWHLASCGRNDEIQQLLVEENSEGRNGLHALAELHGRTASYVSDLSTAWKLVGTQDASPAAALGMRLNNALMLSSLNARSRHLPAALLDRLIDGGSIDIDEAVARADQHPDDDQRVMALCLIADRLPSAERRILLERAAEIASAGTLTEVVLRMAADDPIAARRISDGMPDAEGRIEGLVAIARHLPAADSAELVTTGLLLAFTIVEHFRPQSLEKLGPLLSRQQVTMALRITTANARSVRFRDENIGALVSHVAKHGQLENAREIAHSLADNVVRASALAGIVPFLAGDDADATARAVLSSIADVDDEAWRNQLQEDLAAATNDNAALLVAVGLADLSWRTSAIKWMAEGLSAGVASEVLAVVLGTPDPRFRATGFVTLHPALSTKLVDENLPLVIESARAIRAPKWRTAAMIDLVALAKRPQDYIDELLDQIVQVSPYEQAPLWKQLAPLLGPADVTAAMASIGAVSDREHRSACVGALAHLFDDEQSAAAAAAVQTIEDSGAIALATAALAVSLPAAEQRKALQVIAAAEHDGMRAKALALLAAGLSDDLVEYALSVLGSIEDTSSRCETALPALAKRFGVAIRETVDSGLTDLLALDDFQRIGWALAEIGPYLDAKQVSRALHSVRDREPEPDYQIATRAGALATLLPYLAEQERLALVPELLDVARTAADDEAPALLLAIAGDDPSAETCDELVEIARSKSDYANAKTLAWLLPQVDVARRVELISEIVNLSGEFVDLGFFGADEQREQILALVVPHLPGDAALVVIADLGDRGKSAAICAMAANSNEQHDRLLEMAATIADRDDHGDALMALLVLLPSEHEARASVIEEAVALTLLSPDNDWRRNYLAQLGPMLAELPELVQVRCWDAVALKISQSARPDAAHDLAGLAPALVAYGGHALARDIFATLENVTRWWR